MVDCKVDDVLALGLIEETAILRGEFVGAVTKPFLSNRVNEPRFRATTEMPLKKGGVCWWLRVTECGPGNPGRRAGYQK
jgi:hypothetical protein